MPARVLIVESDIDARTSLAAALVAAGFHVSSAATFSEGKRLLDAGPPFAALVTGVRLGAFNGIQLIVRARATQPLLGCILTTRLPDPPLETEARPYGAECLVAPWDDPAAFVETVTKVIRIQPA
jgi:DNA-binding NtrC family response regulator